MGSGVSHSQLGAVRIPDGFPPWGGHQQPDWTRCGPFAGAQAPTRGIPAPSASFGLAGGLGACGPSLHRAPFSGRRGARLFGRPSARRVAAIRRGSRDFQVDRIWGHSSGEFSHRVSPAQHLLLGLIGAYRRFWIPAQVTLLGPAPSCRFTPTCSAYASEALRVHGAVSGSLISVRRLCRCHPWGGFGHDPVPPVLPPPPHAAVTFPSS